MSLKYGVFLPQGHLGELASIKDSMDAYETLTCVAQTADECGYESVWLPDHFHTILQPSREVVPEFECWTSTAALARDTK